jgi:iron complex transport system permease protein
MIRRRAALTAALLLVAIMLFLLNISIGSSSISLSEILTILVTGKGQGHNAMIVREVRLPMALMAIAVGACLGIGGCEIQTILRNPIASPYTLGITNAATFGAALGLILNTNVLNVSEPLMVTTNAFIFALFASVCIYAFSCRRGAGKNAIILFGIALNFLFSALTMVLQYISDDEDLKSLVFWNMGSLLKTTWTKLLIVTAALVFCFIILGKNAWRLTAMTLDDTKARSLGVNTHRVRRMVIILTSMLTAFAVCFVGSVGFVGIIAPHIARQLVGEEQRFFLPLSGLIGAVVVSLAFMVSKLVIPGVVLPIGLVTAVIGIPVFLAIIFGRMRRM